MRIVSFIAPDGERPHFGAVIDGGVIDLSVRMPHHRSFARLIEHGLDEAARVATGAIADYRPDELNLLPASPSPAKIICAAVNYADHRKEMQRDPTEKPMLFLRTATSLAGHRQPLVKSPLSDQFDYEGELAVIIGRRCRHVPREQALDVVAGYACFNDGTMRDWQRHTSQFTPGKNFDRSGSLGPWMLTRDAFGDYRRQSLITRLNGTEVQRTTVDLMLFDIETLIAYVTAFTTLEPGDVIATGTCGGVGVKRTPPLFMQPGDSIEVEVTGLGTLSNQVVAEMNAV